jgi:tryptophan-rich sensory protein
MLEELIPGPVTKEQFTDIFENFKKAFIERAIIAVTYGAVFYKAFTGKVSWMVALPFALNLIFNLAFTPIQFGLKNNLLATLDILLVVGTLVWALVAVWNASPDLR